MRPSTASCAVVPENPMIATHPRAPMICGTGEKGTRNVGRYHGGSAARRATAPTLIAA